jgi:hypothetical protein
LLEIQINSKNTLGPLAQATLVFLWMITSLGTTTNFKKKKKKKKKHIPIIKNNNFNLLTILFFEEINCLFHQCEHWL